MAHDEYGEYAEGYEVGEEAAEEPDWGDRVQRGDAGKSDIWWKGFRDGREGIWDPPAVEEVEHKE
jgi:hypothetical protein